MDTLSLESQNLLSLEDSVKDIESESIKDVQASKNRIRSLLPLIKFGHLTSLNVSENSLLNLPADILGHFPHLECLDVSKNRIMEITALEVLPNLKTFLASHNRIRKLTGLEACRSLVMIDVSHNLLDVSIRSCGLIGLLSLFEIRNLDFRGNPLLVEEKLAASEMMRILPWVNEVNGRANHFLIDTSNSQRITRESGTYFKETETSIKKRRSEIISSPRLNEDPLVKFKAALKEMIGRKERLIRKQERHNSI
jgi:Leucine-rich repeat (LRR) protein